MKERVIRRTAKMDLMTGFTGKKPPDLDLGLKGNSYFERWTTLALPDTGKNSAVDDDQQPVGSGAEETAFDGPPLKVPMEADDVGRPRIRDGREARRREANILRKVALEIRRLEPATARRLMAAADEIDYDTLSTASLDESGDEDNEVDDYQDNLGHGKLQFFGTAPPRKTSLARESSRRQAGESPYTPMEVKFRSPGNDNWEKKVCNTKAEYDKCMSKAKDEGAEIRKRPLDRSNGDVNTKLEYASRGASRRRSAAEGKGVKDVDWTNTLKLVESAMSGRYDPGAVATILKSDYDRTMSLLRGGGGGGNQQQTSGGGGTTSQSPATPSDATAGSKGWSLQARRRARTQGDKELHPPATVGDQDGPVADGAGGFADRAKAPLQKSMSAEDVDRPKIRENPEASRSLWSTFKNELLRTAGGGGKWNSGRYSMEARDYGDSVEVQASVIDRENMHLPVGSILFSVLHDSPKGRYATVEINDGILENRTTEFTLRKPRQATLIVSRLVGGITRTAKDVLNGVTV